MKTNTLKRSEAVALIQYVAHQVGQATADPMKAISLAADLKELLSNFGVKVSEPCTGEAHKAEIAGNIDHCMVCAPHWGWIRQELKIR